MLVRPLGSETDPLAIASEPLYVTAGTDQNRKGTSMSLCSLSPGKS